MYTTVAAIELSAVVECIIYIQLARESYTWSSKQLSLNMPNTQTCYWIAPQTSKYKSFISKQKNVAKILCTQVSAAVGMSGHSLILHKVTVILDSRWCSCMVSRSPLCKVLCQITHASSWIGLHDYKICHRLVSCHFTAFTQLVALKLLVCREQLSRWTLLQYLVRCLHFWQRYCCWCQGC